MKFSRRNNGVPVSAYVNGTWRKCGILRYENGRPIFEQKIRPDQILRIRGAAGVDLRYEPELPPGTVVRHIVGDTVYEITLGVLRNHPKTDVRAIGPFHPTRMYLIYKYWKEINPAQEQLSLFNETENPGQAEVGR